METPIQKAKRILTKESTFFEGADCAFNYIETHKMISILESILLVEREIIEQAFVDGSERGTGEIPFNCEQYFSQTFKNDNDESDEF